MVIYVFQSIRDFVKNAQAKKKKMYGQSSLCGDLPVPTCSPVVENPLSSAADMGSILGQGTKTSHAVGQLSLRTVSREAHTLQLLSPCRLERLLHN